MSTVTFCVIVAISRRQKDRQTNDLQIPSFKMIQHAKYLSQTDVIQFSRDEHTHTHTHTPDRLLHVDDNNWRQRTIYTVSQKNKTLNTCP